VDHLLPFMCGIANHLILDFLRRESRTTSFDGEVLSKDATGSPVVASSASPQAETLSRMVAQEVARLPEDDQEVLKGCFFEGLSCADLSRRTAEPASRIRKRKSRAILRLRDRVRNRSDFSALRYWAPQ
jgi:DNA-directed RNA polymerase specialized sigma24 family protein